MVKRVIQVSGFVGRKEAFGREGAGGSRYLVVEEGYLVGSRERKNVALELGGRLSAV